MKRNDMLELNLQLFADGGEADESGESLDSQETKDSQGDQGKQFTQEQVNSISSTEHKKGQSKGERDTLEKLGFESLDEAKQAFDDYKAWKEEQMTEADKQAEALAETKATVEAQSAQIKALEAENVALKLNVKADSVKDSITLAEAYVNDETDIEEALKQVLEKYPHFKQGKSSPAKWSQGGTSTVGGEVDAFEEILNKYK